MKRKEVVCKIEKKQEKIKTKSDISIIHNCNYLGFRIFIC